MRDEEVKCTGKIIVRFGSLLLPPSHTRYLCLSFCLYVSVSLSPSPLREIKKASREREGETEAGGRREKEEKVS